MFTAALFAIARTWKQLRYPLTDEWIKKLWYIYTMEYYSAIKRNTFESVLMRWMNLEPIIQSEVSQKEKNKYCMLIGCPIAQLVKNPPQCRRPWFDSWVGKIHWRRDGYPLQYSWASLVAQLVKNPPTMWET